MKTKMLLLLFVPAFRSIPFPEQLFEFLKTFELFKLRSLGVSIERLLLSGPCRHSFAERTHAN
jgi:hypothetical protein